MKAYSRYMLLVYFILLVAVCFTVLSAHAETDGVNVDVKNSVMPGLTDVIITCYGQTFYSTVRTNRLNESIKKLEAWAETECTKAKNMEKK